MGWRALYWILIIYTVCAKKGLLFFQTAVTHLRIVEITKVGRVLKRAGADLSKAKIFEIKVDPVYYLK